MDDNILNDKYQLVATKRLKIHPRNPRRGNVAQIRELIRENSFFGALVVQKSTCHVLAGNHRLMAAREEGLARVPVIWVDVDDAKALKIMLSDNKASDGAGYDAQVMADILQDIDDISGTGFNLAEVDRIIKSVTAPDEFPDVDPTNDKAKHTCPKCKYEFD